MKPANVTLREAKAALIENSKVLDPKAQRPLWNLNIALLAIVEHLQTMRADVDYLGKKLGEG